MKIFLLEIRRRKSSGYASMAVVAAVSLMLISMLTFILIGNINSFDSESKAQVKQDYSQKEDAILSSLLHIVPNKAIGAMQENSASSASSYTWEKIFSEALTLANAEQSANPTLLASLDLSDSISSNTGDVQYDNVFQFVNAPVHSYAGGTNVVNGGNWWEFYMLGTSIGQRAPAALQLSYADYLLDKKYPIISFEKRYVDWYTKGLNVSPNTYRDFNLIEYPDIKFGFKRPGQLFVAKRNWWVFSLTFGKQQEARTGIPPVKKTYSLSIYEIPSQLPLSASSIIKVGQYEDGTDWRNVTIAGGINANSVQTIGDVALTGGAISARESVNLSDTTTVDNQTVSGGFDEMGDREERALKSNSDFYSASTGGNVGKVAFIPINPGLNFLKPSSDGNRSSRISPTGWKEYSRGANRVNMRIVVTKMVDENTQIPVKFTFYFRSDSNGWMQQVYERGSNWPTEAEPGGDSFPFQSDELANLRNGMILHLDRLPAFLDTIENAGGIEINNSIHITTGGGDTSIQPASVPSLPSDMAVSLRGGKDMTGYTNGFSILTDHRLYIAETLNATAGSVPPNAGFPPGAEFYPPISVFAPEKRFGESLDVSKPVMLAGQLGSLMNEADDTFNPLELKKANDDALEAHKVTADLTSIRSPAELPPINLMNWMVTIEEIH